MYAEQAKKKPVYCSKCKDINTMHTHFNNLKIWLKSVNKLDTLITKILQCVQHLGRNTKQVVRMTVKLFLSYVV